MCYVPLCTVLAPLFLQESVALFDNTSWHRWASQLPNTKAIPNELAHFWTHLSFRWKIPLTLSLTAFFCLSSHGSRSYETPLQSRPRWKMKTIMVSVCASVCPNTPREMIQNRAARQICTFFAITSPVGLRFEFWKDWLNPQSMLIPNLFRLFWMFASKGFKSS